MRNPHIPELIARPLWLTLLATLLLAAFQAHADQTAESLNAFPRTTLQIATPDARLHTFHVWVADTDPRRAQGLMFIKELAADAGMLFIYPEEHPLSMWMKNTYIPLDMVFIHQNGRVSQVVANTVPHSLKTISSQEDVSAVLELNAGTAAKLGIAQGAIVMHPVFGNGEGVPARATR